MPVYFCQRYRVTHYTTVHNWYHTTYSTSNTQPISYLF